MSTNKKSKEDQSQLSTISVTWTGIRPAILSNPQTVQLSNKYSVEGRSLNKKLKAARKKGDENVLSDIEQQQFRNDWESSAYWDDTQREFFMPDSAIAACIRGGAKATRRGKDIDRGIMIASPIVYFSHGKKFKSLDDAYDDPAYQITTPVRIPPVTGNLIYKRRCMIPTGWTLSFDVEFSPEIINRDTLEEAMVAAGALSGIGAWRPKFGRFTVMVQS